MTFKQYNTIRLILVAVVAMIVGQSVVYKNFLIATVCVIVSSLLLIFLRRKVKEIIADERDYIVGGKSALLAIQIYSWVAVIAMFVFWGYSDLNPAYEPIALTLAFSTCILMILYSVIFRYHNKVSFSDKKMLYGIFVLVLFLFLAVFSLRLFSGEDSWMCKDGQWVEHGHPSFPAPTVPCK